MEFARVQRSSRACAPGVMLLLLLIGFSSLLHAQQLPRVVGGLVDARAHNFAEDGDIPLRGEWEFAWERFISPTDTSGRNPDDAVKFISVPGSWNGYEHNGEGLPGQGYATYRVQVLIPEGTTGLGLKILDMGTAFEIFVNGESVYRAGEPGMSRETSAPRYDAAVVGLDSTGFVMEIIVHVSNFDHRLGGMWEPISLGTYENLVDTRERRLLKDALLFGCILIMGLYHLTLFASRQDRRSILWFGVFCLLIALRILVTGERYFTRLFPGGPWELVQKLEYLSFYLAVPVFLLYLTHLFRQLSVKPLVVASVGACLAFGLVVAVTPTRIFTNTLTVFQITTVLVAIYAFVVLTRALISRQPGSRSILIGFFLFFATVLNDILYAAEVIHTFHAVSVGLLVFIFSQAMHIARIFNLDFLMVRKQSIELQEANAIINSSPAVAFRWKAEPGWPVEFVSENIVNLTGYTAAEVTSAQFTYSDLIHPGDIARVSDEVSSFADAPEATQSIHEPYRIVTKSGDVRWVSDKTFLHRGEHGQIISYRGIIEDVTELKKINDELASHRNHLEELVSQRTSDLEEAKVAAETASMAKSEFLASMSHELRTPLNHIIGFAGLVAEGRVGSLTPEQDEYLNDALSSARHLLNLINEILDIAKVESGSLSLETSRFSLPPFLDDILRSFREQASEHDVAIVSECDDTLDQINADERRLKQILINLLSNAVKFSPDGGTVTVTVSRDGAGVQAPGRWLRFSVSDQGLGIAEADKERIFESFEQVKNPMKSAHPGTGLGLAICRSLVLLHGGDIWVESGGPGAGSTFVFTLPDTEDPAS